MRFGISMAARQTAHHDQQPAREGQRNLNKQHSRSVLRLYFLGVSDAMVISWPCFAHSTSLRTSRWSRHQSKIPLLHSRGSWGFHNLETGTSHPCKVIAKNIRGAGTAAKGRVDLHLRALAPSREMSFSCSATPCPSSSLCFIPIFLCDGHTTHLAGSWEKWRTSPSIMLRMTVRPTEEKKVAPKRRRLDSSCSRLLPMAQKPLLKHAP